MHREQREVEIWTYPTFTHRAARVRRVELFINRASKWKADLVQAGPRQVLNHRHRHSITALQNIT